MSTLGVTVCLHCSNGSLGKLALVTWDSGVRVRIPPSIRIAASQPADNELRAWSVKSDALASAPNVHLSANESPTRSALSQPSKEGAPLRLSLGPRQRSQPAACLTATAVQGSDTP